MQMRRREPGYVNAPGFQQVVAGVGPLKGCGIRNRSWSGAICISYLELSNQIDFKPWTRDLGWWEYNSSNPPCQRSELANEKGGQTIAEVYRAAIHRANSRIVCIVSNTSGVITIPKCFSISKTILMAWSEFSSERCYVVLRRWLALPSTDSYSDQPGGHRIVQGLKARARVLASIRAILMRSTLNSAAVAIARSR